MSSLEWLLINTIVSISSIYSINNFYTHSELPWLVVSSIAFGVSTLLAIIHYINVAKALKH